MILACMAFTVYMVLAAIEDYKSLAVTRWKHLIGLIPALLCLYVGSGKHPVTDYVFIFVFVALFMAFGHIRIYGLADGFVLANLTLLFGGIGGVVGIGAVVVLMILAAFSMVICHIGKAVVKKKGLFHNYVAAFVPHLCVGYVVMLFIFVKACTQS